jgi:uncharacterized protein YecA (UPF0149 family)
MNFKDIISRYDKLSESDKLKFTLLSQQITDLKNIRPDEAKELIKIFNMNSKNKKVSVNALCSCGSGKKNKKCCYKS